MQECESLGEPADASESTDNMGPDPWALTELADTSEKWSGKALRNGISIVIAVRVPTVVNTCSKVNHSVNTYL